MAFDEHAVRHRLKLVRDDGEATLYENRDGVACPVCGETFDEFYATAGAETFRPTKRIGFCVAHSARRLLLFTHDADSD